MKPYHLGAVLNGLLGVEGAILPGDALANDAGVLVDEDSGRRRRRSEIAELVELIRAEQPR